MSEQAWNFIKKETPAQVFSCDFYEIFLEHLFYRTFPGAWYDISFLLESPSFWVFLSSNLPNVYLLVFWFNYICFCFTYGVISILQIVLTLTKFVRYVCWLNKSPPSFFVCLMNWCKKEKKTWKLQWMFYPWFLIKSNQCLEQ